MAKKDQDVQYIYVPSREGWMATFSDLVTLLITFFVLLISMSSMNDKAFNDVFGFFNDAIGPLEFATRHSVDGLPSLVPEIKTRSLLDSTSLSRSLLNAMEKKNIGGV
ncbi:MAG: flagellar motor protein MotB, partial [Thermodesulfobacteriota bacterium]|nr:flagellar motor protein MotB [Thermodesulfobacteriota bacterium]